jgi:hypothetical protein
MRSSIAAIALSLLTVAFTGNFAQARPWLITDQAEHLFDFNDSAPPATNQRTINVAETATMIVGIDFSPSQELYGMTTHFVNPPRLYRINPVTGAATLVGSTGLSILTEGDIGFDPTTGQLYGLFVGSTKQLMTINTTTGAATLIGPTGLDDPSGLAFDSSGNLWVLDTKTNPPAGDNLTLHRINKTNGSVISTITTNLAASSMATLGMDFAPDGNLYVAAGNGTFYRLNTTTGVFTNLGSHGVTGATGLAVVPEPSTLALVAVLPVLGIAWAWRRKRKSQQPNRVEASVPNGSSSPRE